MSKTIIISILMIIFSLAKANSLIVPNSVEALFPEDLIGQADSQLRFGYSVATDKDIVLVGAPYDDDQGENGGAVFLYRCQQGNQCKYEAKIISNKINDGDNFGSSVAIHNNIIVVGAPNDQGHEPYGAAYIFYILGEDDQNNLIIGEHSKLIPTFDEGFGENGIDNDNFNDRFGNAVDIENNTVIVGARTDTFGENDVAGFGSVYIFEKDANNNLDSWGNIKKIFNLTADFDEFGWSLSLSNERLAVGAPYRGSAYIYERDLGGSNNWGEIKEIENNANIRFGESVALDGDTLAVGAPNAAWNENFHAGEVFVFYKDHEGINNWGQHNNFNGIFQPETKFGSALALKGDNLLAGLGGYDSEQAIDSGLALIFRKNYPQLNSWGISDDLEVDDIDFDSEFGHSVAMSDSLVVIGAPYNDFVANDMINRPGSAFVYRLIPSAACIFCDGFE